MDLVADLTHGDSALALVATAVRDERTSTDAAAAHDAAPPSRSASRKQSSSLKRSTSTGSARAEKKPAARNDHAALVAARRRDQAELRAQIAETLRAEVRDEEQRVRRRIAAEEATDRQHIDRQRKTDHAANVEQVQLRQRTAQQSRAVRADMAERLDAMNRLQQQLATARDAAKQRAATVSPSARRKSRAASPSAHHDMPARPVSRAESRTTVEQLKQELASVQRSRVENFNAKLSESKQQLNSTVEHEREQYAVALSSDATQRTDKVQQHVVDVKRTGHATNARGRVNENRQCAIAAQDRTAKLQQQILKSREHYNAVVRAHQLQSDYDATRASEERALAERSTPRDEPITEEALRERATAAAKRSAELQAENDARREAEREAQRRHAAEFAQRLEAAEAKAQERRDAKLREEREAQRKHTAVREEILREAAERRRLERELAETQRLRLQRRVASLAAGDSNTAEERALWETDVARHKEMTSLRARHVATVEAKEREAAVKQYREVHGSDSSKLAEVEQVRQERRDAHHAERAAHVRAEREARQQRERARVEEAQLRAAALREESLAVAVAGTLAAAQDQWEKRAHVEQEREAAATTNVRSRLIARVFTPARSTSSLTRLDDEATQRREAETSDTEQPSDADRHEDSTDDAKDAHNTSAISLMLTAHAEPSASHLLLVSEAGTHIPARCPGVALLAQCGDASLTPCMRFVFRTAMEHTSATDNNATATAANSPGARRTASRSGRQQPATADIVDVPRRVLPIGWSHPKRSLSDYPSRRMIRNANASPAVADAAEKLVSLLEEQETIHRRMEKRKRAGDRSSISRQNRDLGVATASESLIQTTWWQDAANAGILATQRAEQIAERESGAETIAARHRAFGPVGSCSRRLYDTDKVRRAQLDAQQRDMIVEQEEQARVARLKRPLSQPDAVFISRFVDQPLSRVKAVHTKHALDEEKRLQSVCRSKTALDEEGRAALVDRLAKSPPKRARKTAATPSPLRSGRSGSAPSNTAGLVQRLHDTVVEAQRSEAAALDKKYLYHAPPPKKFDKAQLGKSVERLNKGARE